MSSETIVEKVKFKFEADTTSFNKELEKLEIQMELFTKSIEKQIMKVRNAFSVLGKIAKESKMSDALGAMEKDADNYVSSLNNIKDAAKTAFDTVSTESKAAGKAMEEMQTKIENAADSMGSIKGPKVSVDSTSLNDGVAEADQSYSQLAGTVGGQLKDSFDSVGGILESVTALQEDFFSFDNWSSLIGNVANFVTQMSALKETLMGIQGFEAFTTAAAGAAGPIAIIAIGVIAVSAALLYLWETSESFRAIVIEALDNLMAILKSIYNEILMPLFAFLTDIFNTVLMPLGTFLAEIFVAGVEMLATILFSLWNNILAPIASFLVDILAIALQGIIELWESWKPVIEIIFSALQGIWDNVFKPIVDWITESFCKTFESWGDLIKELIPSVKEIFQGLIDFFVGIFSLDLGKAWEGITAVFQGFDVFLSNVFKTDWTNCFGALGNIVNGLMASIQSIWEGVKAIFRGVIDFVVGIFTGDWRKAWEGIKSIFKGIFDSFAGIAKAPLNLVIGLFNGLLDGINWCIDKINDISFDLPGFLGGGHVGFDLKRLAKIPYLARGGIVTAPTPAIIGEAGAEAVLPLENNTGWMSKLASNISDYLGFGNNEDMEDLIILMQELIDVVRNKELSPVIGINGRMLNKSNKREALLTKLRTG